VARLQQGAPVADACESSEACTEQNGGEESLCRARGEPCIPLTTAECPDVAGRWQPRDSLFIGVIGSDSFTTSDGNGVSIPSTDRARKVVDLGLGEWNAALPDGVTASGSSLAVIHCNANREAAQAARALEHLAAIGVPAVIALGDVERDAIADAARARGIPVLCALCTERARNAAGAEVEAWRMQPPLEEQAPLAADRAAQLEQQLRTDRALADDVPIRIALVGQDSPAHRAFVDNVSSRLRFNGGLTVEGQSEGNFWQRTLSDPRRRGVDALQTSSELIAFRPDIVIASMESEVASLYLTMVEGDWPVDQPRPHYVVTAQNRELDFLQALDRYAMDLPPRLSGTAPLVSTEVARNRTDVTARFVRDNREPPGETQGAYDALYVAAYALYAADLGPSNRRESRRDPERRELPAGRGQHRPRGQLFGAGLGPELGRYQRGCHALVPWSRRQRTARRPRRCRQALGSHDWRGLRQLRLPTVSLAHAQPPHQP
jgi:hypothetical protein